MCRNTLGLDSPRAARILEVLTEGGQQVLRLVSTDSFDQQDVKYAALTHCWGGVDIDAKTTVTNVDQYFTAIDVETLPKTFKEAIRIARALKLRYLWIDSLCIVQQYLPDWERESAKMAAIFRNATLTISASSAENSTQGCGVSNLLVPSTQFVLPSPAAPGQPRSCIIIRQTTQNPERRPPYLFAEYPIHSRAWIFQEKILSRRILHATHGLFLYQCATHIESEDSDWYSENGSLDSHVPEYMTGHVIPGARHHDHVRKLWWSWMRDFSERQLSKPEDNYAALAGVTDLYRDITGDDPVLAMWMSDLVVHLAWRADIAAESRLTHITFPRLERRPTWTWMSYPHGTVRPNIYSVHFDDLNRAVTPQRLTSTRCYKAEVIGVDIQWTGRPLVTSPSHAIVKLHGLKSRLSKREFKGSGDFDLDPGIPDPGEDNVYDILALYANKNEPSLTNRPWRLHTACLALEAVNRERNVYRRIGRFLLYDPIAPGKNAEDHLFGTYEEITLI